MKEIDLQKREKKVKSQLEEYRRIRKSELGRMEAGFEESYRQSKKIGYISIAGVGLGLGIMYGSQIYETIKNLF